MAGKSNKTKQLTEDKPKSIDEAFGALDELIESMGRDDISLEESFDAYKKGLELVKYCNESISRIESELEELGIDDTSEDAE
ncbi:MAG: exodeoxyribonuclease VII small subunit [Lachnospiraceae bacterium]|nr:exodeoxyribonuclease VII small subunit [Lachnospiraceae bacterium]